MLFGFSFRNWAIACFLPIKSAIVKPVGMVNINVFVKSVTFSSISIGLLLEVLCSFVSSHSGVKSVFGAVHPSNNQRTNLAPKSQQQLNTVSTSGSIISPLTKVES